MEQKLNKNKNADGTQGKHLKLTSNITVHGYTKRNGEVVPDVTFEKGCYIDVEGCPTEEDIIAAKNEGHDGYVKVLENRQKYWGGDYPESLLKEFYIKPKKD